MSEEPGLGTYGGRQGRSGTVTVSHLMTGWSQRSRLQGLLCCCLRPTVAVLWSRLLGLSPIFLVPGSPCVSGIACQLLGRSHKLARDQGERRRGSRRKTRRKGGGGGVLRKGWPPSPQCGSCWSRGSGRPMNPAVGRGMQGGAGVQGGAGGGRRSGGYRERWVGCRVQLEVQTQVAHPSPRRLLQRVQCDTWDWAGDTQNFCHSWKTFCSGVWTPMPVSQSPQPLTSAASAGLNQ